MHTLKILNKKSLKQMFEALKRLGSDLLSHMTLCSIIGDEELNFRVRHGIGCTLFSMAAKKLHILIDRERNLFS